MILSWIAVAALAKVLVYPLVAISAFLLISNRNYLWGLVALLAMLLMSDSFQQIFSFAVSAKPIFFIVLSLMFLSQIQVDSDLFSTYIPFVSLALITSFFHPYPATSFQKLLSYILMLLVSFNLVKALIDQNQQRFFRWIIGYLTLMLIIGLAIRFVNPEFTSKAGRFSGLLGNPNGLGIFCVLFLFLGRTLLDKFPKLLSQREQYVLLGLLAINLYLCGSRSALLAIGLFFVFRFFNQASPALGFLIAIVLGAGYQLLQTYFVLIVLAFGFEQFFRVETLADGSGRLVAWNFALDEIDKNFWFGKGFDYTNYLFRISYRKLSILGHQGNAHNSYLTFWLDHGLVGLSLYLYAVIASVIKVAKRYSAILPVAYATLFMNFFESWLTASLNPFTIMFFIILAIGYYAKDISETNEEVII